MKDREFLIHCQMVLGLKERTTVEEVDRRYRQLAAQYHPDRYSGDDIEEAHLKFIEIKKAHDYMKCYFNGEDYSEFTKYYGDDVGESARDAQRLYKQGILLYKKGDINNALEHFLKAESYDTENADYERGVIRCLMKKPRRIHEAKDKCLRLAQKDAMNGENFYLLGRIYELAGLESAARKYFDKSKNLGYEIKGEVAAKSEKKKGFFSRIIDKK